MEKITKWGATYINGDAAIVQQPHGIGDREVGNLALAQLVHSVVERFEVSEGSDLA